jgi:1-deoxy-D-xylulose-5-phosphate synthase
MDIGYLRMIPGMELLAPANEEEVCGCLDYALNSSKPCAIRYPKDSVKTADEMEAGVCKSAFECGKSVVVRQSRGSKAAIVSYGCLLGAAIGAADILKAEGIAVDVINARFANPIDDQIVKLAASKAIVTVEDHYKACGFGSAFLERVHADLSDVEIKPIVTLGVDDIYLRHDSRVSQLQEIGLNADKIADAVRKMYRHL